jgi:hypothetical protein
MLAFPAPGNAGTPYSFPLPATLKCGDTILISATGDLDSDATSWFILLSMAVYTVKQLARLAGWRTDGR